jgi:hypothetical protein
MNVETIRRPVGAREFVIQGVTVHSTYRMISWLHHMLRAAANHCLHCGMPTRGINRNKRFHPTLRFCNETGIFQLLESRSRQIDLVNKSLPSTGLQRISRISDRDFSVLIPRFDSCCRLLFCNTCTRSKFIAGCRPQLALRPPHPRSASAKPSYCQLLWTGFDSGGVLDLDSIDELGPGDHGLETG